MSCSADRQILAKITPDGVFLEQLETDPAKYLPETTDDHLDAEAVAVDLNRPMAEIRAQLSRYPVKTRLALSGTMVVARDIAHAQLKERLDRGEGLPAYLQATIRSITRAPPRRRPATPPAASARPPRDGWTATWRSSRPPAGRS